MSEYKELAEKLNEKPHIPRARRIKKNISLIEEILETGVTIKYLVEQLNENGFEIKLETFKTELGRERRKLKNKGNENTLKDTSKEIEPKEKPQEKAKEKKPDIKNMSVRAFKKMRDKEYEEKMKNGTPPEVESLLEELQERKRQREQKNENSGN